MMQGKWNAISIELQMWNVSFTVITGGTTLLVCCSSYGVFKFFQTLRHEGVPGIKKSWENASQVLSRYKNVIQNFRVVKNNEEDLALVPLPDSNGNNQLRKRPSDLMLNGSGKTPTPATLLLNRLNNGNHVSGTNGNEDIASGDEGMGEVQVRWLQGGRKVAIRLKSRNVIQCRGSILGRLEDLTRVVLIHRRPVTVEAAQWMTWPSTLLRARRWVWYAKCTRSWTFVPLPDSTWRARRESLLTNL